MRLSQELTLCFALFCRLQIDMLMQIFDLYLNVPVLMIYLSRLSTYHTREVFFSLSLEDFDS